MRITIQLRGNIMIFDMILTSASKDGLLVTKVDVMSVNTRYIKYIHAGKHGTSITIRFHLYSNEVIESYTFNDLEDCIVVSLLISGLDLIEVRFLNGQVSYTTNLEMKDQS